jgi:uncharacterized protein
MRLFQTFADRVAGFTLGLLAALHALFLAALAAGLFAAAPAARAETLCTGANLLDALRTDDAAAYARLEAEAAKTVNGRGILWRVEKAGMAPSFLFGTMHVTDPRVTALPPAARRAFDGAGTLVIETVDVLDRAAMTAALFAKPELTMFTDGSTLASRLSPADRDALDKGLEARGIPPGSVLRMKPWILSSLVSLPACETARQQAGAEVLDVKLGHEAQAAGKRVEGLESAVSQIEAMASLPMELHLQGLVETLKLGRRLDDVIETMVAIYESGETGLFRPLFEMALPQTAGAGANGYAAFEETMITQRNRVMAERGAPLLAQGNVFMAVGALHLAGPQGVVELLRGKGFTLTAVE